MAGKIFINYRRDDSISTAGRLHDRLAQTFGRKNLFMDVDHIPAGVDFVDYLDRQVAACDVFLAVIGPNWVDAKDDSGRLRLGNPDDYVTIEIAAALARGIRVIPVLVDGARTPKADKLPESVKPLVRRNAVEVRNTNFGRDAEALANKVREALKSARPLTGRWPFLASAAAGSATALLLVGWIGLHQMGVPVWGPWRPRAEQPDAPGADKAKAADDAEAQRKAAAAEQERVSAAKAEAERQAAAKAEVEQQAVAAAAKAEQERKAKAAADAEAKRKAEEAEQQRLAAAKAAAEAEAQRKAAEEAQKQRLAAAKAEEERQAAAKAEADRQAAAKAEAERQAAAKAEAEARAKAEQAEKDRLAAAKAEGERRKQGRADARTRYSALMGQARTELDNRDYDRVIATANEAVRLDPNSAQRPLPSGVPLTREKATPTVPLLMPTRPFDSIPTAQRPLPSGVALMGQKATMTEPLPITPKPFDSIPTAQRPLPPGPSLILTKATRTEPSAISTRPFDSIPSTLWSFTTGAALITTKATTTEPLPITTRPFDLIPRTLSLLSIEGTLI
jgi:hypothetical protein